MIAVQGADHFFQGRLEEVQAIIADFVRSLDTFKQLPETV
jgi:alpha/beta superfamily hydrolase